MTCKEKRIQNNWTQKQYQECVQKQLPDLSEANEKAKEFKPEKSILEKGVDKVQEAASIVNLGFKALDKIAETYSEENKLDNLKNIKISPEIFAAEDSEEYFKPEFLESLSENLSTNDPLNVSEEEDAIFSELGLQLALEKNKDNPDYKPSTMDIWSESYRLKALATKDASGEDATILENVAGKNIVTNVISDVYRSLEKGYAQPGNLEASLQIFEQGNETEDKILQKFLDDKKELIASNQDSDEAKAFQKCVEKNGDGFLSLGLCAIQNPGYIVQAGVESMALNAGSVTQSQTVRNNAFGGVVTGIAAGSVVPGLGQATGAMSGMFYGIGSTLEKGITFDELLIDATGIEDVSKITVEDLRKVLNDPEKLKDIQNKAEKRGQVIGAVSALSGGAAAKTTTALVKAGKGAKIAAGVGGGVEMIGEGVGEYLGQKAAGQALSRQEIFLESFAGLGTKAPISVGGTLLNLNQLSTNLKVRNSVKSNGFASMSDAFKPNVKTDQAQIDISQIPNAEKTLNFELENKVKRKIITPDEAKNIQNSFRETKAVVNKIKPLGLSKTQQSLTVELLKEKKNLQTTINKVNDDNLTGKQSERVNEINEELKNIGKQETQESVTQEAEGNIVTEDTKIVEKGKREIASEEVQEIYETKGREGVVEIIEKFKPIVNKIVQSRKEAPNFDAQLLTDEIETGKRGILDLIDEYDASKGVPLAAFINKHLPLRAIEASKRVLGEKFTLDVTEARGVTDGTDINIQIQEDLDIAPRTKQQQESITKLRDVAGITTEEAQIGVTETLKTKLPGVTEKNFRQKVNEANRLKFGDKVLAEMGGLKDAGRLVSFLDTNFDAIMQAIPDSVKNKQLALLFKPKKIGRAKTKVGKGIFEYATPTKQEVIDFYTTGKNTTNRARVKTLADVIAQELALDATAEVLADPKVQKEFIERQEIQGKEITKDAIPRILEAIDRQIKSLDSKIIENQGNLYATIPGLNPQMNRKAVKAALKIIKKGLQTGQKISAIIKAAINKLKSYFKNPDHAKIAQEVFERLINKDTIKNLSSFTAEEIYADINDGIAKSIGDKYEIGLIKVALDLEKKLPGTVKVIVRDKQTNNLKGADYEIEINGIPLKVEVKAPGSFQISSITVNDLRELKIDKLDELIANGFPKAKAKKLLTLLSELNIDKVQKLAESFGFEGTVLVDRMPQHIYKKVKDAGGLRELSIPDPEGLGGFTMKEIGAIYATKGVHYIQIGNKGLYHMGQNPLNLPVPDISGQPVNFYFRPTYGNKNKAGEISQIYRILPQPVRGKGGTLDIATSSYTLNSQKSIAKLINDSEVFQEAGKINEADVKIKDIKSEGKKFKDSKKGQKIIEKNKEIESQDLSKGFNDIIEVNKGLPSKARYSGIMAKRKGMEKGKYRFFIPPSAEDFKGLLYNFLGKGKIGETQMKWFQEKLINPYNQGVAQMERYRRALKGDYATLLKESPNVRKQLGKKIKGIDFTYDNAVRAYLWNKDGVEIPGLSKRDTKALVDAIAKNPEMKTFAEGLQLISKKPNWIKPTASWDVQSITSDIHNFTSREGRKEYLGEFIDNANQIFSKDNLNKIEGVYGTNVKEALQDALYRMETGINRPSGTNRLTNNFNNWVNRSIGAIMFFNRKSALLQTLSSVNFVNWSDNNPIKAAAAFANQKQYWSDVVKIFNSPKLKSRRAGLKGDINESELASAAANATNKAEAALSYLLKIGFTPTQLADSFAIATGGATFLRNRINTYKNQNMSEIEAEKQAWKDFSAISEETQQSADPSLISQQQASPLGRLILAFQNTPMQYTRLMKKAGQDLINGRGDAKTHISKIIYYGAVQNFIFAALQNALFAAIPGFSGEDDEEEETKGEIVQNRKNIRIANNMVDTVLRGSGVYGAITATLKNTIMKYYENEKKDPFAKDNASILLEAVNLSPPIGSKLRKLNNALKTKEFEKDVISERGWEMTRNGKINLSPSYRVLGSTLEAGLNIPLERTLAEIDALMEMTDQRNSTMERIALGLGWRTWDIGVPNEEHDQIKAEAKERKKQARKDKVISDREEKKRLVEERKYLGKTEEEIKLIKEKDSIFDTNKSAQIISLTNLGLTKKEIRELKLEEERVDKILELTN